MQTPIRVLSGMLAGALAFGAVTMAAPAGALTPVTVTRTDGANLYQVSRLTAAAAFPGGATNVLLARGDLFPDALAASYLAGDLGAPIVLTTGSSLQADAKLALANLKAVNITLLGGTDAISDNVKTELQKLDYKVTRVAGADRYQTAVAVASPGNGKSGKATIGLLAGKRTAIIASGANFPDALAGGPISYGAKFPILLTNADSLNAATRTALDTLKIENVVLLGGTSAVSAVVHAQLIAGGRTVQRIADLDRYGTAAKLADFARTSLGWTIESLVLASGLDFPDAEVGGPLGGVRKAPIVLVGTDLPTASENVCRSNRATIKNLLVQGNVASVSAAAAAACQAAAS